MATFFDNIDPIELAFLSNLVAISFTKGLTTQEMYTLGRFFTSIADTVFLIASSSEAEQIKSDIKNN